MVRGVVVIIFYFILVVMSLFLFPLHFYAGPSVLQSGHMGLLLLL